MPGIIYIRIALYVAIILSILNGWWFVALPILILGSWLYSFGIEWLIAGVAYDALFGMVPGSSWFGYAGTIVAIVGMFASRSFKKMLRSR